MYLLQMCKKKETFCYINTFFLCFDVFHATTSDPPLKRPRCALADLLGATFASAKEKASSAQSARDVAAAEIRGCREEPPMPLPEDPLCWWREHQQEYRQLSKVAKSLLCIPGTSVAAERVFSTAGDIVTAQRSVLKAEHVDKLVFLHKNLAMK